MTEIKRQLDRKPEETKLKRKEGRHMKKKRNRN